MAMNNVVLNGDNASDISRSGPGPYWINDRAPIELSRSQDPADSSNNVLGFSINPSGAQSGFARYQGAHLVNGTPGSNKSFSLGYDSEVSYRFYIDPAWKAGAGDTKGQASGVWIVMNGIDGAAASSLGYAVAEYVDATAAAALQANKPSDSIQVPDDFKGGFRFFDSKGNAANEYWRSYQNLDVEGWVDVKFKLGASGAVWEVSQNNQTLISYVDSRPVNINTNPKIVDIIVNSINYGQNETYLYDNIKLSGAGTELNSIAVDGSSLWVGKATPSGNPVTGFKTADTSELQLALSARVTQDPVPLQGTLGADGLYHFARTPEDANSRFAYSVAVLKSDGSLGDYDFRLQIDGDASHAKQYTTFFLQPLGTPTGDVDKPSGYGWYKDVNRDGQISEADKVAGAFVVISDDEGVAGKVTQNIQNIGWYDQNTASDVLGKGSYDVRLQAFDKTQPGKLLAENHIVIDIAGGSPPAPDGGGGGGGSPVNPPVVPPVAPPITPNNPDPTPNDDFNEAAAVTSVVTFFTGEAPIPEKQAALEAFVNLQFEAYSAMGVANPAMGPYEALGRGFAETIEFEQKYGKQTEADFIYARYQDVFGRAPSTVQQAHFQAQIDYFEALYEGAGINSEQADLFAKGAVLGQMLGHAALDPTTVTGPTTSKSTGFADWDLVA